MTRMLKIDVAALMVDIDWKLSGLKIPKSIVKTYH